MQELLQRSLDQGIKQGTFEELLSAIKRLELDPTCTTLDAGDELAKLIKRYDPSGLNAAEWALLKSSPIEGLKALYAGSDVRSLTEQLWVSGHVQGNADAFRHATWNWQMCSVIGCAEAKKWGDAHESVATGLDREMDLFNNEKGREFFAAQAPAGYIITALEEGSLRRIVNNRLVPTTLEGLK